MAGTSYAAAVARLERLSKQQPRLLVKAEAFRKARDEAIRMALDEDVSVSRIADALGITRQTATELVRRVRG